MSKSDSTKPWRVKLSQGEDVPGGYIRRATKLGGRSRAWKVNARNQERRNRAAAREALARGEEPELPQTNTAPWDTY